jgi:hypothetical protein
MIKRLIVLASLLAGTVVGVSGSTAARAASTTPACGAGNGGLTRLATDPAGDTTYANESVPNSTDSQEDIRYVDSSVTGGVVTFVIGVQDLTAGDPPASSGLLASLDVATDSGSFAVDASRSATTGDTGTGSINGKAATARFDTTADTITVSGPSSLLPNSPYLFKLTTAETRADGGLVLAPLTDSATGSCQYTFGSAVPTVAFDPTRATITVIDTGSEASNPEFNYDETVPGPNGQFVGWWDFSGTKSHAACGTASSVWCATKGPYDPDMNSGSHGTGTTGMAAGTNASSVKTPSACPGCNLAVAKVLNEDPGTTGGDSGLDGSLADAIHWAVDVVHTDVISISIGAIAPLPEPLVHDTYLAFRYARERGVLITVANGNGWADAEGPGQPGGFMNYGNSTDVLSVGANDIDGYLVTTDPEVTGPFTVMTSASKAQDTDGTTDGYHSISGTSFSTPFTAGLAAHLISSGRLCGATDLSPAFLEQLIKDTAVDSTTLPPMSEGYGEVSLGTMQTALGVLCNGSVRPTVNSVTKLYTDDVSGTERETSSNTLSAWTLGMNIVRNPVGKKSSPGVIGLSTPDVSDTEIYQVTLQPGQTLDDTLSYASDSTAPDLDLFLFNATTGVAYNGKTILAASATGGGLAEHVTYRNTTLRAQKVRLVVVGYQVINRTPFSITGTSLGAPVDEGYAAVTPGLF